jgi:multiple sugar transport system substrate-binding protein
MNHRFLLIALTLLALFALAACATPTEAPKPTSAPAPVATTAPAQPTAAPKPTDAPKPTAVPPTATAVPKPKDVVFWSQFDEKNTDPKADQAVGNAYLRDTMPQFNRQFTGKWNWMNVQKDFSKMNAELVAAVQAKGEVPDLFQISLDINTFVNNGTAQDLTAWASAQAWYKDLDPSAVSACTATDGKLYCIPLSIRPQVVLGWKDHFPNGYPKTPSDFLTQAAALKAKGVAALTYYGSTFGDGNGITRGMTTVMFSFGGKYDDGKGKMLLNTPENSAAIQFMREVVAKGYVTEASFAGNFQEEVAFKNATAASFATGMNAYLFLNTLQAPNGTKYAKGNLNDFLDAIAAGDAFLAPFPAPAGKTPGCNLAASGLIVPTGSKNIEGAREFINWIMTAQQNPKYVLGAVGGFPALKASLADPSFQTPYFKQSAQVMSASNCRPWYGTLTKPAVAQPIIMTVLYKLIKEDPTADIAVALAKAQDEYNKDIK